MATIAGFLFQHGKEREVCLLNWQNPTSHYATVVLIAGIDRGAGCLSPL